jgi:flagellar hook assembly protein FlgD
VANLEIHDLRGRRVKTVSRAEQEIGSQLVTWDGTDGHGDPVPAGTYFARLRVDGPDLHQELVRKVTVLR